MSLRQPIVVHVEPGGALRIDEFPEESEIDPSLFDAGDPFRLQREGDLVTVRADNATAVYRVTGESGPYEFPALFVRLESVT